jgi:hypothetical protein
VAIIARGEVVAAGTPAELATPGGVEVETAPARARSPRRGRDDAPRIVRELVAAGEDVYGVRVLTSSLEDAYLEAVGEAVNAAPRRSRGSRCRRRCAGACSWSSRCSRRFLGSTGSAWQAFRSRRRASAVAGVEPTSSRARRCSAWRCSARSSSGTILAVFLTLGAVRGDAERGLLQPLLVRRCRGARAARRASLAAARSAAPYVIAVFLRRA